jgi:Zn-dependent protease with chaperone function
MIGFVQKLNSSIRSTGREQPFDEWLRGVLVASHGMESETWAIEQIRRVMWKLNRVRRKKPKFHVEVLWMNEMTAFTAPGRFIYISRRLLERCSDDELALILAHEAAHHDLGHIEGSWALKLPRFLGRTLVAALFRLLEGRAYSHEWEFAADQRAMELCLAAGFDGQRALGLLDLLTMNAIDYGDLDAAFGIEDESDSAEHALDWLFLKGRGLLARKGSHPALADRKTKLRQQLQKI